MLSVLIPVYNFDIRALVQELDAQCSSCGIDYEILCFDDGSGQVYRDINKVVGKLDSVRYHENDRNLGRSGIRNQLADQASFPYLLFMDCDSGVVSDQYIKNYMDHLDPNTLLYGGRVYKKEPPDNKIFLFHWSYGRNREQQPAMQRRQQPFHSFMTNNFLIPKAIFQEIRFDERLRQYGHEDTIFGMELKTRNISIRHLDNPLEHLGLEALDQFLEKTKKAVENLHFLWRNQSGIDTKLLRLFKRIKKWKLSVVIRISLAFLRPLMIRNFHSENPRMVLFDLYKLSLLLEEEHKIE